MAISQCQSPVGLRPVFASFSMISWSFFSSSGVPFGFG